MEQGSAWRRGLLFFCLLVLMVLAAMPGSTFADDYTAPPWQIFADRIFHFEKFNYIIAEGNVIVERLDAPGISKLVIMADWIRYDVAGDTIKARGHLAVHSGDDELKAESARFDLNRQTGILTMTTVKSSEYDWNFFGRTVEKTGELTYHLIDGQATTCQDSLDGKSIWTINAADIDVNTGINARLKNVSLKVKGIPVAYLPYFVVPIGRQTGFLVPELSQSERDGTGILVPFFLNLSPSFDATLYPGFMTRRGITAAGELRYAADEASSGTLAVNYQRDRTTDTETDEYKSDGFLRTNHDRYWVRAKADHDFGNDVVARMDIDQVSDRDFLQEFRNGLTGFDSSNDEFLRTHNRGFQEETIPVRESTLQVGKKDAVSFLGTELRAVDDEREDPSADSALQALPRIIYSGRIPVRKSPVPASFDWESEYIFYQRSEGVGAHRLDVHPGLVASIPVDYIESTVSTGVRETIYQAEVFGDSSSHDWQYDENQSRSVWDLDIDLATTLARDYSMNLGSVRRFTHKFRPRVAYIYNTSPDQDELPYLDALDRIEPGNWLEYGVGNYFRVRGLSGEDDYNRNLGFFKVGQAYSIREANRSLEGPCDERHPFSDVFFELELYPLEKLQIEYDTAWSVHGKGINFYNLATDYSNLAGDRLSLDYRYKKAPLVEEPYFFSDEPAESIHELNMEIKKVLSHLWSVSGDIAHSWSFSRVVEASIHLAYHPACWSVELMAARDPDDNRIGIIFSLTGMGKVAEFDF